MLGQPAADTSGQLWWNCVSYLTRSLWEARRKDIAKGEGLQNGSLSEGDRTVFVGMPEASIRETIESGCDRRGWVLPTHPTVDISEDVVLASVRLDLELWILVSRRLYCPHFEASS